MQGIIQLVGARLPWQIMGKEKRTHNGEKLAKSLAVIQQEAAPPDLEIKSEVNSTSAVSRLENG